jgi:hypothetical protein
VSYTAQVADVAGNQSAAGTAYKATIDTAGPVNTIEKAIYDDFTNSFTLVGTKMLSITGQTGVVDKNQFDWTKFSVNLGNGAVFNNLTAADIQSVTVDSDSRLTVKLAATLAQTFEGHAQWSLQGTAMTDVLGIGAGFTRDSTGSAATTDGNNTVRFNDISLASGDGRLIHAVLVNDNQLFYVWDRSGNGVHDGVTGNNDTISFNDLAAFMGKQPNNITEEVLSRSFTNNGISLRLPTDGNLAANVHVNPGPNSPGAPDYTDARDIYTPGQTVSNLKDAQGNLVASGDAYVARGTTTGNGLVRLLGDQDKNSAYSDLLAISDAFNGSGTGSSSDNGVAFGTPLNGLPEGWRVFFYQSATPSASGRAAVDLQFADVGNLAMDLPRNVAFEVL